MKAISRHPELFENVAAWSARWCSMDVFTRNYANSVLEGGQVPDILDFQQVNRGAYATQR